MNKKYYKIIFQLTAWYDWPFQNEYVRPQDIFLGEHQSLYLVLSFLVAFSIAF